MDFRKTHPRRGGGEGKNDVVGGVYEGEAMVTAYR